MLTSVEIVGGWIAWQLRHYSGELVPKTEIRGTIEYGRNLYCTTHQGTKSFPLTQYPTNTNLSKFPNPACTSLGCPDSAGPIVETFWVALYMEKFERNLRNFKNIIWFQLKEILPNFMGTLAVLTCFWLIGDRLNRSSKNRFFLIFTTALHDPLNFPLDDDLRDSTSNFLKSLSVSGCYRLLYWKIFLWKGYIWILFVSLPCIYDQFFFINRWSNFWR